MRPFRLPALRPMDAMVVDIDDLDEVEVGGIKADTLDWSNHLRFSSSRIADVSAGAWRARGLDLSECRLDRLDIVELAAAEGSWCDTEIAQSRIGSAEVYDATWERVHFVRCKIGFLNLRASKLTDVLFTDCIIEELDLLGATAKRIAFPGTRIGRLDLRRSTLRDADLREARLDEIASAEGLRGATVTYEQLLEFAPALATHLGIHVG